MRKITFLLSFLFVVLGLSAQTNLVKNPSFESDFADWAKGPSSSYTAPEIKTSGAQDGTKYVEYVATATTGFYQEIPVTAGKTYTVSFWYKASGDETDARIWSVFKDASNALVYYTTDAKTDPLRTNDVYLPPSATWTKHEVAFTAPSNAVLFQLHVRAYNGGTAAFDNFSLVESSGGTDPDPDPDPDPAGFFVETFDASQGGFTIVDLTLPEGGTYVWKWDTYKYMKASAYISGANKASESWLISPSLNLTGKATAVLSFDHAGRFYTPNKASEQSVWISTNYTSGAPSTATWTQLTVPVWSDGSNWTFVNSGDIDISSIAGQSSVRIAFKYASTTEGAATWEIKNVLVKTTDSGTGLGNTRYPLDLFVNSGKIIFNASVGETIEVYNAMGQKLYNAAVTTDGLNEVAVSAKGVVLVKVGNRTGKVVL